LFRKPEGKSPLRRIKCSTENINTDLKEIGWTGKDLINQAQDKDEWWSSRNTVMGLRIS
jgi:hypothetical protein